MIGPPGAGKTSVGKAVAKATSSSFSDTDNLIEMEIGKSIAEIFVDDGEEFFRAVEERICLEALRNGDGVLSLGGGAPLSINVQNELQESGVHVVFLCSNSSIWHGKLIARFFPVARLRKWAVAHRRH